MNGFELKEKLLMAENNNLCPECGARMIEENRVIQESTVFIWYRCSKDDCKGQWLRRLFKGQSLLGEYQMSI